MKPAPLGRVVPHLLALHHALCGRSLDLSGFNDFRLILRFDGPAGAKFVINELYGPAGGVAQLNVDIASGALDPLGSLNYRGKFDIFGPKSFFIRVFNHGAGPIKVNGSLYAAE